MELVLRLFDAVHLPGGSLLVLEGRSGFEYRAITGRVDTAVVVGTTGIEFGSAVF